MRREHIIRAIAGTFILLSLALAHFHNPNWLWFTAFVGANLLQSSFTKWCLMCDILTKLNIGTSDEVSACCEGDEQADASRKGSEP